MRRTILSGSGKLVQHISYIDNVIIPSIPQTSSEPTFLKAAMRTTNGQDQDESGGTEDVHVVGANGLEPNGGSTHRDRLDRMDVGFAARVLENEETIGAKNEIKLLPKGNG